MAKKVSHTMTLRSTTKKKDKKQTDKSLERQANIRNARRNIKPSNEAPQRTWKQMYAKVDKLICGELTKPSIGPGRQRKCSLIERLMEKLKDSFKSITAQTNLDAAQKLKQMVLNIRENPLFVVAMLQLLISIQKNSADKLFIEPKCLRKFYHSILYLRYYLIKNQQIEKLKYQERQQFNNFLEDSDILNFFSKNSKCFPEDYCKLQYYHKTYNERFNQKVKRAMKICDVSNDNIQTQNPNMTPQPPMQVNQQTQDKAPIFLIQGERFQLSDLFQIILEGCCEQAELFVAEQNGEEYSDRDSFHQAAEPEIGNFFGQNLLDQFDIQSNCIESQQILFSCDEGEAQPLWMQDITTHQGTLTGRLRNSDHVKEQSGKESQVSFGVYNGQVEFEP